MHTSRPPTVTSRPNASSFELRDGPFRDSTAPGISDSLAPAACKVEFDLRYDFASRVLERLIGPVFDHIATTFIDAFVKRADNVYKQRS